MGWLLTDLSMACKILKKDGWFSLLNIIVIAIGSAVAIYAYSLTSNIAFSPIAMNGGKEIFMIEATVKGESESGGKVEYADYIDLKKRALSIDNLGAYYIDNARVFIKDSNQRFSAAYITPEMFSVTGQLPLAGRAFNNQDMIKGSAQIVILGEVIAKQMYGDANNSIGKNININGVLHQVVGVMPHDFEFPVREKLWLPLRAEYQEFDRTKAARVAVFGQLGVGQTQSSVNAELNTIASQLALNYPQTNQDIGFMLFELKMGVIGEDNTNMMKMVLSAALVVLTLACVNVASLLSVRASKRIKETSVQIALGAPRYRVISKVLAEAVIICCLGAVLGMLLCLWGLQMTQEAFNSVPTLPFWWQVGLDNHTVIATFAVILFASLLSGIWPSLQSSEKNFNQVLRDGTRGALGKRSAQFNYVIVFIELCFSFVILVYSGINLARMDFITSTSYGVKTDNVVVGDLAFEQNTIDIYGSREQFYSQISNKLKTVEQVNDVAIATILPGNYPRKQNYQIEGVQLPTVDAYPHVNPIYVSNNFFNLFGMKLITGRQLDSRDDVAGVNNVVVDEKFVEAAFTDGQALGKRFRLYNGKTPGQWMTIVGVVNHVIYGQVQSNAYYRSAAYIPLSKSEQNKISVALQVGSMPGDIYPQIRQRMYDVDKAVPIYSLMTLNELIENNSGGARFMTAIFSTFALAALVLSASCIFAVIVFLVSLRQQDIAVRRALGSTEWGIFRLYLQNVGIQYLIAASVGLSLAYMVSQTIDTVEFAAQVPWVFVSVSTLMLLLVIVATLVPLAMTLRKEPYAVLGDL
jgi:predicted permease